MITRRRFTGSLPVAAAVAAAGKPLLEGTAAWAQPAAAAGHFDPKGKRPSTFTIEALNKARDTLPFADQRAFEEQRKGLIAAMPDRKIMAAMDGRERHRHPAHIYTLRGAPVRDPLNWSKFIGQALYRFGREAEVMFASHHWPRWGKARIQEVPRGQRDLYANMNNQVLHLADKPDLTVTINRADLKPVMDGARTLEQQIASGLMKVDGDVGVLTKLASTIVDFDPRFQIMRGTKIRDGAIPAAGAYEVMPRNTISE